LGTSSQFDTFGSTAAEIARKQAEKEQKQRCILFLAAYLVYDPLFYDLLHRERILLKIYASPKIEIIN
jgi:hypothetical protein